MLSLRKLGVCQGGNFPFMFICPLDTDKIKLKYNIMARLDSIGLGQSNVRTQPSGGGSFSSGSFIDSDYDISRENILSRIKSSFLYRELFSIFSKEADKYWLNQLQAILDSVIGTNNTFLDDLGFSSASGDKNEAIYQEAINNMQALYNEYRSYKNSLPINQVAQLSAAGINSAITGQGVSSSEMPERNISSGASSMPSTSTGEFALNVVSGFTSVVSAFADVALKFRDLDLRNRTQNFNEVSSFAQFKKLLSDEGILLSSSSWSELDEKDKDWNVNASSRAKALYNSYKEYSDTVKYAPILSQVDDVASVDKTGILYNDRYLLRTIQDDGSIRYRVNYPYSESFYGASFNQAFSEIGQMQVELSINEAMRKVQVGQSVISEGLTPEDVAKAEAALKKSEASYNSRKAVIYLQRLESLISRSKNNDPIASVELINLMQDADWQESAAYMIGELTTDQMQILGSAFEMGSKFNVDAFHKLIDLFKSRF